MIDRKVIKTNPQGKPVTVVTKSGPTGYEIEKINQKNVNVQVYFCPAERLKN